MNILIFGTGNLAISLEKILEKTDFTPLAYMDNNQAKWGTTRHGLPVLAPGKICSQPYDKIIIASSYVQEIEPQLLKLGCRREDILIFPGHNSSRGIFNILDFQAIHRKWQTLIIPVTNRCNLRCSHCVKGTPYYTSTFTLDLGTFHRYLSRFTPEFFQECCLSAEGELTTLPSFPDYLRAAKDLGWNNLSIITNGTFQNQEVWDQIVAEELLSGVTISVEAGTKKPFENVRGYPFENFINFLNTLKEVRRRHHSKITCSFNSMLCTVNIDELLPIVELAARFDIRQVTVSHLVAYFDNEMFPEKICRPANILDQAAYPHAKEIIDRARDLTAKYNIQLSATEPFLDRLAPPAIAPTTGGVKGETCFEPYRVIRVRSDGGLYPCAEMLHQYPLGNLNETVFHDMWTGEVFTTFLSQLKKKPLGSLASCRRCPRACLEKNLRINLKRPDYARRDDRVVMLSDTPIRKPEEWLA